MDWRLPGPRGAFASKTRQPQMEPGFTQVRRPSHSLPRPQGSLQKPTPMAWRQREWKAFRPAGRSVVRLLSPSTCPATPLLSAIPIDYVPVVGLVGLLDGPTVSGDAGARHTCGRVILHRDNFYASTDCLLGEAMSWDCLIT